MFLPVTLALLISISSLVTSSPGLILPGYPWILPEKPPQVNYTITIKTGDHFGSGITDLTAYIFVQVGDAQGKKLGFFRHVSDGHFLRGNVETFTVNNYFSEPVNEVCSLVIGHYSRRFYAPWYVDYVTIQTDSMPESRFPVNKWIKYKKGESLPPSLSAHFPWAITSINRCGSNNEEQENSLTNISRDTDKIGIQDDEVPEAI